jgi:hypothetical protein
MLLNAITSYPYCDAELIEDNNIYKFIIKFNNYYRVPDNDIIDELYDVIEELKPAHLAYEHTFTYNWWGKEDNGVWNDGGTWDDLRNYTEV